jgi:hypothetical protein
MQNPESAEEQEVRLIAPEQSVNHAPERKLQLQARNFRTTGGVLDGES